MVFCCRPITDFYKIGLHSALTNPLDSEHISSYSDGDIVNAPSKSLRNILRFSSKLQLGLKRRSKRLPNNSAQLRSHLISDSDLPLSSSSRLLPLKVWPLLPLLLLPCTFTAQALSATTAQRIEGTKPYIILTADGTKLKTLNELMGFSMPDGSGGMKQIDATMSGTALAAPTGMKFSDVKTAVLADGVQKPVSGARWQSVMMMAMRHRVQ